MKNLMKLKYALVLTSALVITACNSKTEESTEHADHAGAHSYICPMNCENGKTYDKAGKCPVCGMDLEAMNHEASEKTYYMDFTANPAQVELGKAAKLSFTPKIKGQDGEAVPLEIVHDKKLHLIVVSKDLSWFDHIHPEYTASDAYEINVLGSDKSYTNGPFKNEVKFETGGEFVLFADYAPTGASHQLERIELNVAGKPYAGKIYDKEQTTDNVDGYTVTIESDGGKWLSAQQSHISAIVKQGSKEIPADQFENYLGAKAHMVVISSDSKDYLHVHPEVVDGRLDLHTTFKQPGVYRGWLQFQTAGKVHTADFTIVVAKGVASANTEHEGHDESKEHSH